MKTKETPKKMEFKIEWCHTCRGNMVICPKCGNNSCNAGYGSMDESGKPLPWNEDGIPCDVCPLAYQYQSQMSELMRFCICPWECSCKRKSDIDESVSFFDEHNVVVMDPKCEVHNGSSPSPDCPVHSYKKD